MGAVIGYVVNSSDGRGNRLTRKFIVKQLVN